MMFTLYKLNTYGADIVGLIVGTSGACAIGNLGPDINSMFSVTKWSCPTGCYTFGHEIGHVALRVELREQNGFVNGFVIVGVLMRVLKVEHNGFGSPMLLLVRVLKREHNRFVIGFVLAGVLMMFGVRRFSIPVTMQSSNTSALST